MKPIIKYFFIFALALFAGAELNAQEKNTKKKQDSTYLQNKQRSDEQRNREAEEKRKNDSIKKGRYIDSLSEMRRMDSVKYARPVPVDTINPAQRKQDSLDKSQPKQKDKKMPPKQVGSMAVGSRQSAYGHCELVEAIS